MRHRMRSTGALGRLLRSTQAFTLAVALFGCGGSSPSDPGQPDVCGPYPDWETSDYVLPYAVGTAFRVAQGNCTSGGHMRRFRHSYDFDMSIGTEITASRAGVVVAVIEQFSDQTAGLAEANIVRVQHGDGSIAEYGHLTQNGALVEIGDSVDAGAAVGLSGNSGFTGGFPHLHFHVVPCETCETIPVTFRNTDPNPEGLVGGVVYAASPH